MDFIRNSTTPNMKGTTDLTDHPQETMPTRNHDEAGNHRENASKDSEKQDTVRRARRKRLVGVKHRKRGQR
jgi:hypothetical protein